MNSKILMIVIAIVIAAGAFFGGMKYQQNKTNNGFALQQGQLRQKMGQNQGGQGQIQAFRPVRGDILSVDNNTLTVKLSDGSSKIVVLSETTTYLKEATSTKDDLKTGTTVSIVGKTNADGSVTAQNVQINPVAFRVLPTQEAQK
jgi:hypothetical protein